MSYLRFAAFVDGAIPIPVLGHVVGAVLLFAFNLGIAAMSYHVVELPFLRLKRLYAYQDEELAHQMVADQSTTLSLAEGVDATR